MTALEAPAVGLYPHRADLFTRFWSYVDRGSDDECWEWKGARTRLGYGVIGKGRRGMGNILAHRLSYLLYGTERRIGDLCVLHRCDNPPCVNPAHLWVGTRADNNRDMCAKGRHRGGGRRVEP